MSNKLTASKYAEQVYLGDREASYEEIWDLVVAAAQERDVCEVKALLGLMYETV